MLVIFHFLYSNIADNKSPKNKWHLLFFTHIKLVAYVLTCARIKWRRLGPYGDVHDTVGFFKTFFTPEMGKIGLKQDFLNFLKNFVINLLYLVHSCANPVFGKSFAPDIWAKMLLAKQITGILRQICLWNQVMKQPDFLHVDTNSRKLKVE